MARFTHDMTFFHHDVRGKRFNAHRAKANFLSMPICSGIEHENLRIVERLRDSKCVRTGTEDSAGPPHCVGPLFSGANAGSTLRPRPGALKRNMVVVKTLSAMKIAEKLVDLPAVKGGAPLPESISQTETQTEISGLVRINGAHLGIIAEMVADTWLHVETQLRQDIYLNAGSTVY